MQMEFDDWIKNRQDNLTKECQDFIVKNITGHKATKKNPVNAYVSSPIKLISHVIEKYESQPEVRDEILDLLKRWHFEQLQQQQNNKQYLEELMDKVYSVEFEPKLGYKLMDYIVSDIDYCPFDYKFDDIISRDDKMILANLQSNQISHEQRLQSMHIDSDRPCKRCGYKKFIKKYCEPLSADEMGKTLLICVQCNKMVTI